MYIKKITLLSILSFAYPLLGQDDFYLEGGLGMSLNDSFKMHNNEYFYDHGALGNISLGYHYNLFRFEIEGKYKQNNLLSARYAQTSTLKVSGKLKQISPMLNAYYSSGFNEENLASSIGLGLGTNHLTLSNFQENGVVQEDISKTLPALQAMITAEYKIDEAFNFITKYTFFIHLKTMIF